MYNLRLLHRHKKMKMSMYIYRLNRTHNLSIIEECFWVPWHRRTYRYFYVLVSRMERTKHILEAVFWDWPLTGNKYSCNILRYDPSGGGDSPCLLRGSTLAAAAGTDVPLVWLIFWLAPSQQLKWSRNKNICKKSDQTKHYSYVMGIINMGSLLEFLAVKVTVVLHLHLTIH